MAKTLTDGGSERLVSSGAKPNLRLALLPLFSVIGASSAVYLAKHYYDLRAGTAGFKSLCNIGEAMNCDAVTSSRFAEIMPGLPLASFVAGWFVAILILSLMARVDDWRREAVLVTTLMTGFASLYSVALLAVMAGILHKFCLFCLVIDAMNFALFATCLTLVKNGGTSIFGGARWPKIQSNALVVLGAVFVMVVVLRPSAENQANQASQSELQYQVNQILEHAPVEVKTPPTAQVIGDPNAPVTIHEFSDFQCPFCKRGAVMMNQVLARHEGKVKIVFMPFPLDNACNRLITRPMHPYSCALARAAYCSGSQGKFRSVYEKIFEDQDLLTADSAEKIPATAGVDQTALKSCADSDFAKKAVGDSIDEGIRLKVESTPTFFVNGKRVEGVLPLEAWDQVIAGVSK
ncbi:MAG: thioredoxin domain-containing protein [Bdellovibrionales bacterium]|nr:thioredoxin domain-containing protein [Bdellovibrionales bacterium]